MTTARQKMHNNTSGEHLYTGYCGWISGAVHGTGQNPRICAKPSGIFRPSQCGQSDLLYEDWLLVLLTGRSWWSMYLITAWQQLLVNTVLRKEKYFRTESVFYSVWKVLCFASSLVSQARQPFSYPVSAFFHSKIHRIKNTRICRAQGCLFHRHVCVGVYYSGGDCV